MRRSRQHRKLPLPAAFKPERREHWVDRHERETEELHDLLSKRLEEETAKVLRGKVLAR